MSSIIAKKVIRKLMAEDSEALKEIPRDVLSSYDLTGVDADNMLPSDIKKLSDAIARNRLVAPGLPQEDIKALLRRIGH